MEAVVEVQKSRKCCRFSAVPSEGLGHAHSQRFQASKPLDFRDQTQLWSPPGPPPAGQSQLRVAPRLLPRGQSRFSAAKSFLQPAPDTAAPEQSPGAPREAAGPGRTCRASS